MVNFHRLKNILYYIFLLSARMNLQGTFYLPFSYISYSQPWIPVIIPNNQVLFSAPGEVVQEVQFSNYLNYGQQIQLNLSRQQGGNVKIGKNTEKIAYQQQQVENKKTRYYKLRQESRPDLGIQKSVEMKKNCIQPSKMKVVHQQCESFMDMNQTGKTNWTLEQQDKLKQMVNLFGKRWKYISEHFQNRTGKQIRQRYLNYLRPNLHLGRWTEEEDEQILKLVAKYGRSWKTIEKKLKNRSQNQIKNRYYGHLNKSQKAQGGVQKLNGESNIKISLVKTSTQLGEEMSANTQKFQLC